MSISSQQKNMKAIHSLVSRDLSYIRGERESGPNGIKKQFHTKSAAFLRTLGKDLGFKDYRVVSNHGGIAVSGDITLMGIWNNGNGLYFQIFQSLTQPNDFLYRHITGMKDYSGGQNQWLPVSIFANGDYEQLLFVLGILRKPSEEEKSAA